ncbi:MAG: hypothetical protein DRH12_19325 [Deltaproteobacteria bacterium]|nr:MAG: hypothetical protein DRH12_19325 [Deltaproteobacteria bacterium]
MGFFGDEYLALDNDPSVLAKLLIEYDSSDKKTLSTGEEWELAEGWSLVAQQIDLDGNKVWLELKKDGTTIDSAIIDSDAVVATDRTYVYEDSDDRAIFYCYIDAVFRGVESNVVQLKYVFLRSDNLLEIDNGDTFGNFDVKGFTIPAGSAVIGQAPAGGAALAANDVALYMRSNTDITLDADDDDTIYGDVILHTADDAATLRCYLQKTVTIAGATAAEEEVTPTEEVTTPAEENVTAPAGEEGAGGEEEAGGAPGFEALFAVAGLLAVSYLVLRRRD